MLNKNKINKLIRYITDKETILVIIFTLSSLFNIIYNYNNIKHLYISIFLIILYFIISRRNNKFKIFIIYVNFALFTSISEYLVVKYANRKAINYQKNFTIMGLPYWLIFSAYPSMVLNLFLLSDIWNIIME